MGILASLKLKTMFSIMYCVNSDKEENKPLRDFARVASL